MPTLALSDHLTPKSTIRHRPIGSDVKLSEPPRVPRASRTQTRTPKASTTALVDVPGRNSAQPLSSSWRQSLLPIGIGIGMLLSVILVLLGQFLIGWLGNIWDDLHYGYPRTYQVDSFVGQGTVLRIPVTSLP